MPADSTAREIAERLASEYDWATNWPGAIVTVNFTREQLTELLHRALADAEARVRQEPGLALSIQHDPLAVSDLIADSIAERQRLERLVYDIRQALGPAALHVLQADLTREVSALSARLAAVEQALRDYGKHKITCACIGGIWNCNCGLSAALGDPQ
jgi:hypothetical protein